MEKEHMLEARFIMPYISKLTGAAAVFFLILLIVLLRDNIVTPF
jgi:hypothetical protein